MTSTAVTYRQAQAAAFHDGFWWTGRDGRGETGVVEVHSDGTLGRFAFRLPKDDRVVNVVCTPGNQGCGPFYSPNRLRFT